MYVHEIVVEIHRRFGITNNSNRRRVGVRAVPRYTCEYCLFVIIDFVDSLSLLFLTLVVLDVTVCQKLKTDMRITRCLNILFLYACHFVVSKKSFYFIDINLSMIHILKYFFLLIKI